MEIEFLVENYVHVPLAHTHAHIADISARNSRNRP
jgi:hypothetical protein